jgi:hypothetical protein
MVDEVGLSIMERHVVIFTIAQGVVGLDMSVAGTQGGLSFVDQSSEQLSSNAAL